MYEGERNESRQRHGKGKNTFPNGDTYEGMYLNGTRNGYGVYRWKATGAQYSGEYKDNLRDGQGLFVYPDGSRYKGRKFQRDARSKICIVMSVKGQFAQGKRQGQGTYFYVNGDYYSGEWQNDLKHGMGIYTYTTTGSKVHPAELHSGPKISF